MILTPRWKMKRARPTASIEKCRSTDRPAAHVGINQINARPSGHCATTARPRSNSSRTTIDHWATRARAAPAFGLLGAKIKLAGRPAGWLPSGWRAALRRYGNQAARVARWPALVGAAGRAPQPAKSTRTTSRPDELLTNAVSFTATKAASGAGVGAVGRLMRTVALPLARPPPVMSPASPSGRTRLACLCSFGSRPMRPARRAPFRPASAHARALASGSLPARPRWPPNGLGGASWPAAGPAGRSISRARKKS